MGTRYAFVRLSDFLLVLLSVVFGSVCYTPVDYRPVVEYAERLAAANQPINQAAREQSINRIRSGHGTAVPSSLKSLAVKATKNNLEGGWKYCAVRYNTVLLFLFYGRVNAGYTMFLFFVPYGI